MATIASRANLSRIYLTKNHCLNDEWERPPLKKRYSDIILEKATVNFTIKFYF